MGRGVAGWNNIMDKLPLGEFRELGMMIENILGRYYRKEDYNNPFYDSSPKFILEELREALSSQAGSRYNLFPSDGKGSCHKLAIGIAELDFESKSKKDKYGFRGLLGKLLPHWFECHTNQYNILFTSSFNRDKFNLSYEPLFKKFDAINRAVVVIELAENDAYIVYQNKASFKQLL